MCYFRALQKHSQRRYFDSADYSLQKEGRPLQELYLLDVSRSSQVGDIDASALRQRERNGATFAVSQRHTALIGLQLHNPTSVTSCVCLAVAAKTSEAAERLLAKVTVGVAKPGE